MIRFNSVVVMDPILSTGGVQSHIYCGGSSLSVMSSGFLLSCGGGLLSRCEAVSSLVGVWVAVWGWPSLIMVLGVPR